MSTKIDKTTLPSSLVNLQSNPTVGVVYISKNIIWTLILSLRS